MSMKSPADPLPTRRAFLAALCALPAACSFPPAQWPRQCVGGGESTGCREVFWSYSSLQYCRARALRPESEERLAEMLRALRPTDRLTVRGGGAALDSQSLNADTVLLLDHPNFCGVTVRHCPEPTVTAGAGATWGAVMDALRAQGLAPYCTPSASYIRVGGGFAANAISRLASSWGREERYIQSFRIMTLDGVVHECFETSDPDSLDGQLWALAPGSLGYLGVVMSVTYRVRRLSARAMVRTHWQVGQLPEDETSDAYRGELEAFFGKLQMAFDLSRTYSAEANDSPSANDSPEANDGAFGTVWWTRAITPRLRTLTATVRYDVDPPSHPCGALLHDRDGSIRIYGEYLMAEPGGESSIQNLNYYMVRCTPDTWDTVEDFSFFQDADLRARLAVASEWRMTAVEQAFCVPRRRAADFLKAIDAVVRGYDHFPTLVDVLYVKKDGERRRALPLSATKDGDTMIFTLAYLDRNGERWTCTRAVYRDLAHRCAQAGGRIYLAKTVEADPADMNAMWGDGVRALWAFRQRVDPHCNLTNEFWRRNFECILSPLGGAGNGVCTLAPP